MFSPLQCILAFQRLWIRYVKNSLVPNDKKIYCSLLYIYMTVGWDAYPLLYTCIVDSGAYNVDMYLGEATHHVVFSFPNILLKTLDRARLQNLDMVLFFFLVMQRIFLIGTELLNIFFLLKSNSLHASNNIYCREAFVVMCVHVWRSLWYLCVCVCRGVGEWEERWWSSEGFLMSQGNQCQRRWLWWMPLRKQCVVTTSV